MADGTTVLVVGGAPGEAFRPSPWEWSFSAAPVARAGDHAGAIAIMRDALERYPDNAATLYTWAATRRWPGGRTTRSRT
ncbi:MAG TPA: hypothetical protein VFI18_12755 [Gaiellales bacterium]|nr:hypothetical protein [Gaiellales bacterium]